MLNIKYENEELENLEINSDYRRIKFCFIAILSNLEF